MKIRKYSLCALAVGLVFNSSASVAQETAATVERIQVTGSNIKRNDLEGSAPVQVIGREDIDRSGFANLQQLLETLPAAGTGTFSTRGNNQDSTANGGAAISLRGFGASPQAFAWRGAAFRFTHGLPLVATRPGRRRPIEPRS